MDNLSTPPRAPGRTRRQDDGGYASPGAVRQHGGKLPAYFCNTCQGEVAWAESTRTGRKYLVNITRGYLGQRFYMGHDIHRCEPPAPPVAPAPPVDVAAMRAQETARAAWLIKFSAGRRALEAAGVDAAALADYDAIYDIKHQQEGWEL